MIDALIAGAVFGLIAQYARLNTFSKIVDSLRLKSCDAIQIVLFAVAVSSIAFFVEFMLGGASIDVKPFYVVGIVLGGLLFGIGVAILGYCPGTMVIALAEGRMDALLGCFGGLAAGLVYTLIYPSILPMIGPNLGTITLYTSDSAITAIIVVTYAMFLIALALWAPKRMERNAKGE